MIIDPRVKEMVMATKLSTGESVISFVNIISQHCFLVIYPYVLNGTRIADEYFPGTDNRMFPISPEYCLFTKTMSERYVEEFLALIQLDNSDCEQIIEQLTETLDSEDESVPDGVVWH